MTDNTNIIKEASQRNTLKDLVDGAYAAIQLGEIESARVMLKSALALIEKGEVMWAYRASFDGPIHKIEKEPNPYNPYQFPVLVIPLGQEKSE